MEIDPGTPRGNRGLASLKSEVLGVGGDDPLFDAAATASEAAEAAEAAEAI